VAWAGGKKSNANTHRRFDTSILAAETSKVSWEQQQQIEQCCLALNISKGEFIRTAIDNYLQQQSVNSDRPVNRHEQNVGQSVNKQSDMRSFSKPELDSLQTVLQQRLAQPVLNPNASWHSLHETGNQEQPLAQVNSGVQNDGTWIVGKPSSGTSRSQPAPPQQHHQHQQPPDALKEYWSREADYDARRQGPQNQQYILTPQKAVR